MRIFSQVVVVDEAAQSVEMSTLIPLQLLNGCHCVLVGDPQQLPPTVFTQGMPAYERSLFERSATTIMFLGTDLVSFYLWQLTQILFLLRDRLESCGYPVHMLNMQYRMHPKISFFPRTMFYNKLLKVRAYLSHHHLRF
jgi:senataxin